MAEAYRTRPCTAEQLGKSVVAYAAHQSRETAVIHVTAQGLVDNAMKKIILLALAAVLAAAPRASAQSNATLVPSVSIGTTRDDNLFATEKGEAGTMTVIRPGLEANYESPTLNFQ